MNQPAQRQNPPGTEQQMRPAPDHGETSYRGSGRLAGKAAVVTGADSGIGKAVAIAFARDGCAADGSRALSKIAEPGATARFPVIVKDLVPPAVPDPSRSWKGAAAASPLPAGVRCQGEQVASITRRRADLA